MDDAFGGPGSRPDHDGHRGHDGDEWVETLVRTVAHLAAQLTMTQIRLRALASELAAVGAVAPETVADRVGTIAASEAGTYLRENLGEALSDVIDLDALERDVVTFLAARDA